MEQSLQHRRFLMWLVASFSLICLLAGCINYVIDPYGIFGTPRIDGLNARKPAAGERVRTSKPYMATALRPVTVIAGNSRPELGLDPLSSCWQDADQPVFNTGIPGASFHMQTQYAKHALSAGGGKQVLLALDFVDFLENTQAKATAAPPDWVSLSRTYAGRLNIRDEAVSEWQRFGTRAKDKLGSLFSLNTLADSLQTITQQSLPHSTDRRADGFNPGRDYEAIIRNEGQHVLFQQKNAELSTRLARPALGLFISGQDYSESFESLKAFLSWAKREKVTVRLFVNPYHADYLNIIQAAGLWPVLEDWKRQITQIAGDFNAPLWDFNTLDAYSSEEPPGRGQRGKSIRWYWEPAHYKREMGELMLAKMLDKPCVSEDLTTLPGTRLNSENLEAHLAALRSQLPGTTASVPNAARQE